MARLAKFTGVFGVTLTLDGSLFPGPKEAWLYVMQNRLLGRFVRDLKQKGHLQSGAYFWVIEFQEETEQAHWHLLLDASFIDHGELVEIWSRFRPASAEPLAERITAENYKGQAPAFGSVGFTRSTNRAKAAWYATKYLTKYPAAGYPAWVLDHRGRVPRYGHSHKFFPRESGHPWWCFCEICRGDVEPPPRPKRPAKAKKVVDTVAKRTPSSIRTRLGKCGDSCDVVEVQRVLLPDGNIIDGRGRYGGKLDLPFEKACEHLGIVDEKPWQLELCGEDVGELETLAKECELVGRAA